MEIMAFNQSYKHSKARGRFPSPGKGERGNSGLREAWPLLKQPTNRRTGPAVRRWG